MPNTTSRHTFARHVAPFAPVALGLLMQAAQPTSSPSPAQKQPTEVSGSGFSQMCSNPQFPANTGPTSIDETTCTLAGSGGAETWQNEAKNNFCAVGPAKPVTIPDLIALQTKVEQEGDVPFGNPRSHPLSDRPGPATDRTPLKDLGEGTEVTLQGFVLIARQEGAESVNCGSNVANTPENHDIHISIVQSPGQSECSGVVVEMIPHHRPASWTPASVNEVASQKLPVRVTGQLMFDSSHTPCQNGASVSGDPKRAALWEVHPVYKFEVCTSGDCSSGNGWTPLEEFAKD